MDETTQSYRPINCEQIKEFGKDGNPLPWDIYQLLNETMRKNVLP